jgi:Phage portal protein
MGIGNAFKRVVGAVGLKSDWSTGGWNGIQPPFWSMDYPLNRSAAFASTGILADRERIENDFESYVQGAYKSDGPVFACITARQMVFSEAEFAFKAQQDGKIFTTASLQILQTPWPSGTTGELLARMEQDVSLAGNSWWTTTNDQGDFGNTARKRGTGQRLAHMRPDWVTMIIGSKSGDPRALDAKMVGVIYQPLANGTQGFGGNTSLPQVILLAEEVAHYSPIPDPIARFRGMSWLTPVLRHIEADKAATTHKASFFENAAVPNLAIKFAEETNPDDIEEFKKKFDGNQRGKWNAYKTLFLMGGADPVPLTHDFKNMDFTSVIGKGESSIAAAAGVPPGWVGFSEGLQGSALNAGNIAASRRRFADGTIRPLWRIMVASLATLVDVPAGSVLWWDEDGIAFLREDQTDRANIMHVDATSIDAFVKAGFEPDASVAAVVANDANLLLGKHTGLVSVQMQPPVDPTNKLHETEGAAKILQTMAQTIQTFTASGFTHESAILAAQQNDVTLLEKDTDYEPWTPTGQPTRNPGPGADGVQPPAGDMPVPFGAPPPGGGPKPPTGPSPSSTPTGQPTGPKPPTTPKGGNSNA